LSSRAATPLRDIPSITVASTARRRRQIRVTMSSRSIPIAAEGSDGGGDRAGRPYSPWGTFIGIRPLYDMSPSLRRNSQSDRYVYGVTMTVGACSMSNWPPQKSQPDPDIGTARQPESSARNESGVRDPLLTIKPAPVFLGFCALPPRPQHKPLLQFTLPDPQKPRNTHLQDATLNTMRAPSTIGQRGAPNLLTSMSVILSG
jgi:hypothetical protein